MANIKWIKPKNKPGVWIQVDPDQWSINSILRDDINAGIVTDLEQISKWCVENKCGKRMAYDMWKFKNKSELTVFLLRWS